MNNKIKSGSRLTI